MRHVNAIIHPVFFFLLGKIGITPTRLSSRIHISPFFPAERLSVSSSWAQREGKKTKTKDLR